MNAEDEGCKGGLKVNMDSLLISYCSPTLARLKMASLICLKREDAGSDFKKIIDSYNHKYNQKGLYFRVLHHYCARSLVYVYRPDMVAAYLSTPTVSRFLQSYGYRREDALSAYLARLEKRFRKESDFPHETGIFLGYPLEDVCGFILNKGNGAKLCGCWKVYGNAEQAKHLFKTFKACRQHYINRFAVGINLETLIVA